MFELTIIPLIAAIFAQEVMTYYPGELSFSSFSLRFALRPCFLLGSLPYSMRLHTTCHILAAFAIRIRAGDLTFEILLVTRQFSYLSLLFLDLEKK